MGLAWRRLPGAFLGCLVWGCGSAGAAEPAGAAPALPVDYSQPALLTGTVYEKGSDMRKVLFTCQRTATRSNSVVRSLIEFRTADGVVAARERTIYDGGELVAFELEQVQAGSQGRVVRSREGGQTKLAFEFTPAKTGHKKTGSESPQRDTLVNDMIGRYVQAHWDSLNAGVAVKFRYVALERAETVGFKLVKEAETTWGNKPAIRIRMEPTSLIIAALVDPLYFTVEKNPPHRILSYVGRVTPKIEKEGKWKDLDAVTVYDWK
jgi:hypothetical protein